MTHVISSSCIAVKGQSCVSVYPVDCVHHDGEIDLLLYIDPAECIDCGASESACPVTAVFAEDDVPDAENAYKEINTFWFKDKEDARNKVLELV